MTPILTSTLPIQLTNGNTGRGHAHWQTTKIRKQYETDLRLLRLERKPFDFPVEVCITRILGPRQRLWDAGSVLRGSAKELIDSLVAIGWLHDDGPRWIVRAIGEQDASDRGSGPTTRIDIYRATGATP